MGLSERRRLNGDICKAIAALGLRGDSARPVAFVDFLGWWYSVKVSEGLSRTVDMTAAALALAFIEDPPFDGANVSPLIVKAAPEWSDGERIADGDQGSRDELAVYTDRLLASGDRRGEWLALWLADARCPTCEAVGYGCTACNGLGTAVGAYAPEIMETVGGIGERATFRRDGGIAWTHRKAKCGEFLVIDDLVYAIRRAVWVDEDRQRKAVEVRPDTSRRATSKMRRAKRGHWHEIPVFPSTVVAYGTGETGPR